MDKATEQGDRPTSVTSAARGESTRAAILDAAAELIGELGWGAVSTRAIAERAQVPHGAVSYHFRGKHEVLREAALAAVSKVLGEVVPALEGATVRDVVATAARWYAQGIDERSRTLLIEVTMACTRDEILRDQFGHMLDEYRAMMAAVIRSEQAHGSIAADLDASGLSAVIIAALDGILLHLIAAPAYDVRGAAEALTALIYGSDAASERRLS